MPSSQTKKKANANPTKRFFVDMLTRDIELGDAILDLLDNCIDGILRTISSTKKTAITDKPYQGYKADITLNDKLFKISDNCGGMPLHLAEGYAFRFGREDEDRDEGVPTVGVYGIGMKRALFKIGSDSIIESHHPDANFKVHIPPQWLTQDGEWELPIDMLQNQLDESDYGVTITIKKLHKNIQKSFDINGLNFAVRLKELIKVHYAYILKKGFEVTVNGEKVTPMSMRILQDSSDNEFKIEPYVYTTQYDGVSVELVMGMYEKFATEDENEEMAQGLRSKSTAGWTIICNDRVVLSNDTTHVTGWGEAGVPSYHSQFIAISGVVIFSSNEASKLPITTTKRGIDQNSELYSSVKDIMRDALKVFTGFTNRWKSQTQERFEMQKNAKPIEIQEAVKSVHNWVSVRRGIKGQRFTPSLPQPKSTVANSRITFNRQQAEVSLVKKFLLGDEQDLSASQVGEAAFDYVLLEAK